MTDSPQTELHWYVAKTFRRERKIKERLEILGIEHFIPFHKVVKQFGARRVAVEEPIVNGIIFIRYDFRGSIALVNDYGFEMRYLRNRETRSLLVVPDKQMRTSSSCSAIAKIRSSSSPPIYVPATGCA